MFKDYQNYVMDAFTRKVNYDSFKNATSVINETCDTCCVVAKLTRNTISNTEL